MKVISVGSTVYLGELEEGKKGELVIKSALCLGAVSGIEKKHLSEYIKAENTGKLEKDISIRGQGGMFSERPLSDDLTLELDILRLKFKQAQSLAIPELVNKKFSELVG